MPLTLICEFYDEKEIGAATYCMFALLVVSLSTKRKMRRKMANENVVGPTLGQHSHRINTLC